MRRHLNNYVAFEEEEVENNERELVEGERCDEIVWNPEDDVERNEKLERKKEEEEESKEQKIQDGIEHLKEEIEKDHQLGEKSGNDGLKHYRKAGENLCVVKKEMNRGKFKKWVEDNFEFSCRTANIYMKVSEYWDWCKEATSLVDAMKMIKEKSGKKTPNRVKSIPKILVRHLKELKEVSAEWDGFNDSEAARNTKDVIKEIKTILTGIEKSK